MNEFESCLCPCGGVILVDTEEWIVPRCHMCATEDGETDHWRCVTCLARPYACLCESTGWMRMIREVKANKKDNMTVC